MAPAAPAAPPPAPLEEAPPAASGKRTSLAGVLRDMGRRGGRGERRAWAGVVGERDGGGSVPKPTTHPVRGGVSESESQK